LLFCAVVAGCAGATPPPASAPTPTPAQAAAPAAAVPSEIRWARDRKLAWTDFRGPAPANGAEGARTVYLLSYGSRCRGEDFSFDVSAVFLPAQSWVKPRVLTSPSESARVLGHEQTHFDLTEVYARRMRRYFAGLYNPCALVDEQLRESVDRFVKDEAESQRRYDQETGHGLMVERQRAWDRTVAELLGELAKFTGN
jgi:hypothetical protein